MVVGYLEFVTEVCRLCADPRAGRERFYRQNALTPGRWMRVVVDCNDVPSWVVTVLIQDDHPRPHQVQ